MLAFAAPLLIYSLIWRRSTPTLGHIVVSVGVGAICYGLARVAVAASPDRLSIEELELSVPLLTALQLLVAAAFASLVPSFGWLARPTTDKRALERSVITLGLVALVFWQGHALWDSWRMRPVDRLTLNKAAAQWLHDHSLPSETIGASQPELLGYLSDRHTVALPNTAQPATLLTAIDRLRPDYGIALDSLAWHGVQAQPWFQQRYQQVYQLASPYDSAAPLTVFRRTPSAFDAGERINIAAHFTPDTTEWIELDGMRLDSRRISPNEALHLTLYWHAATPINHKLFLIVRLVDQGNGKVWTQVDNRTPGGLATDLWNAGAQLTDHVVLVPPAHLPPGDYVLNAALYAQGDNDAPILTGAKGNALRREPLMLARVFRPPDVSTTALNPDHPIQFTFGEEIELIGYDAPQRVAPGDEVRVALYWRALRPMPIDYKVFVHILGPDGRLVAQTDSPPLNWSYPTTLWQPGEHIRDEHLLSVDPTTPRDDYALFVGLYDGATGERAMVRDAAGSESAERRVLIQRIQVR
jgi:hypothetical protein